jgi:exo-1,4-beta-D-glucosaminidase
MVHLRVARTSDAEDVVPIFWDDNYFSLLPGEKRQLSARFESAQDNDGDLMLAVDGWNVVAASDRLMFEGGH